MAATVKKDARKRANGETSARDGRIASSATPGGPPAGARAACVAVASRCTVAIREPEVEMTATETNWELGAARCAPISWSN